MYGVEWFVREKSYVSSFLRSKDGYLLLCITVKGLCVHTTKCMDYFIGYLLMHVVCY